MKSVNAQRLIGYRLLAVQQGYCYVCRCRPVKDGARYCYECMRAAKERRWAARAAGRCINCGAQSGVRSLCRSCAVVDSHTTSSIRLGEISIGNCGWCHKKREQADKTNCDACLRRFALARRKQNTNVRR